MDSLGFSMCIIISSVDETSFIPSFLIWTPFISLSCPVVLARISSIMLSSGKSGHLCLVPDLGEKPFSLLPLSMHDVSYGFFINVLYQVEEVAFYLLSVCPSWLWCVRWAV